MSQRLSPYERLDRARREYERRLAELRAISQCASFWPGDRPDRDYPGTRCDLLQGHPDQHRCRVPGSRVVVTW